MEKELLTLKQIEERYKLVKVQTIRKWISDGRLPAIRVGKLYFVKVTDFENLFEVKNG